MSVFFSRNLLVLLDEVAERVEGVPGALSEEWLDEVGRGGSDEVQHLLAVYLLLKVSIKVCVGVDQVLLSQLHCQCEGVRLVRTNEDRKCEWIHMVLEFNVQLAAVFLATPL